jgi:hypothetical protein
MEEEKRETHSAKLAQTVKTAGLAGGAVRIVRTAVLSIILVLLAVFTWIIGLPWYIEAVILGAAAVILLIEVLMLKRVAAVELQRPNKPIPDSVPLEAGEALTALIPGVMQYGKMRSYAVLGTGKVMLPENALLITTKAVWALTVPLPGTDKVVSGVDIGKWQWMTTANEIIGALQRMIETLPLEEVLRQSRAIRLISLKEIKAAAFAPVSQGLILESVDGKKYSYAIRRKEDYLQAAEIFSSYKIS